MHKLNVPVKTLGVPMLAPMLKLSILKSDEEKVSQADLGFPTELAGTLPFLRGHPYIFVGTPIEENGDMIEKTGH